MAIVQRSNQGVEIRKMSLSQLVGCLAEEIINYREVLSKSVEAEKEYVKKEYNEKVEPLRAELDRREQLYLKYEKSFIEH